MFLFSLEFITFFSLLLLFLVIAAPYPTIKKWGLLLFSLIFFIALNSKGIVALVGYVGVDYILNQWVYRTSSKRKKTVLYFFCIFWELAFLLTFKLVQQQNWTIASQWEQIQSGLIWVGISFFVFKSVTLSTAIYQGSITRLRFVDYANYLLFFPQLMAGPIAPATQLYPQLEHFDHSLPVPYGKITLLIGLGLVKKIVVADYLGYNYVQRVFEYPSRFTGVEVLVGIYAYALQIFSDFSSYTDLAIAMGLLLGIQTPNNFDRPYWAHSITDFWRRWHITLSQWLWQYLFNPINNRIARWVTRRKELPSRTLGLITYPFSIGITMGIAGLWHGFKGTYLVWGLWFALGLILEKIFRFEKWSQKRAYRRWIARLLVFHWVCVGWIFFRSENFETVGWMFYQLIFSQFLSLLVPFCVAYWKIVLLMVLGFGIHFLFSNERVERWGAKMERWGWLGLFLFYALIIVLVLSVQTADVEPFIYLQY